MLIERNGGIHVLKVEKKKISILTLYDFFLFYFQTGQISKSKRRFEKGGELNLLWRFW